MAIDGRCRILGLGSVSGDNRLAHVFLLSPPAPASAMPLLAGGLVPAPRRLTARPHATEPRPSADDRHRVHLTPTGTDRLLQPVA